MARSTVHYADKETNRILKALHNKFRPAGTPVQRVEYIIELLLLRIFNVKLKRDDDFMELRKLFSGKNENMLFSSLSNIPNDSLLSELNDNLFPFYAHILAHAKEVCTKNLGQKLQDQLVLMEEVFRNSNFTNNVKSGKLQEILSLVAELDEDRLLETDLLGDAIESALSETGGTKDIGLYRTPDHVRQFMVGLVDPDYSDEIFDPACGTAGFLFDAFGYVLGRTKYSDKDWPGPKAHPELADFYCTMFKENPLSMPSNAQALSFYRTGIHGIEYLGMIRKMAAINFYIRGLNPQNIEQGDSLAMFDHHYKNKFSVVLANPPFGAERDQDAYPNVWEEYPKEAETTILFVKLMLDSLAPGGRCAVVVSEGFMTWDQYSARALRKLLLEEANLKAIISLPQGVFISKGGAGPKTSILYFEKGEPTRNVWFYRVTNDGYTMGTNRKVIDGCQMVEALQLFNQYIRNGENPPESSHCFTIPVEWITSLDPRIKERIAEETTTELEQKRDDDLDKLKRKLDQQVAKGTIDKRELGEKISQMKDVWKSRIANEIAKRIERAHLYSFNLTNYRSNLSESQITDWLSTFPEALELNGKSLDKRFEDLHGCPLAKAHEALSQFDIRSAVEYDIVREYLSSFDEDELRRHSHLAELQKSLEVSRKYPRVKLCQLIEPKFEKIKKDEYHGEIDIVEKITFADGSIVIRDIPETGMDLYVAEKGDLIVSKINLHQGATGLASRRLACSTHYQVFAVVSPDVRPEYLHMVLRSGEFLSMIIEQKTKGIKTEQGADFLRSFEIPLPPVDEQDRLLGFFTKVSETLSSYTALTRSYPLYITELNGRDCEPIGKAVIATKNGWSPKCDGGELAVLSLSCLKNGAIDITECKYTSNKRNRIETFFIHKGDFFYSRGNTKELVALAGIVQEECTNILFPDLLTKVVFNEELIYPEFAVLLFNSTFGRNYFGRVPLGASPSMVKVSQTYMMEFPIPFIGDLNEQRRIVEKYNSIFSSLKRLSSIQDQMAEAKQDIFAELWG